MRNGSSTRTRRRLRFLPIIAVGAALATQFGTGLAADTPTASGYSYSTPEGLVCWGGDTAGPTIEQYRVTNFPQLYSATDTSTELLNHVYDGTVCRRTVKQQFALPQPQSTGTSTTTNTDANVPQPPGTGPVIPCCVTYVPGTDQKQVAMADNTIYGCAGGLIGCVEAQTTVVESFHFESEEYNGYASLDLNYPYSTSNGPPGVWVPKGTNFHDNDGNTWAMAVGTSSFTTTQSQCGGCTYRTDELSAVGYGTWHVTDIASFIPIVGPIVTAVKIQNHTLHVGLAGNLSANGGNGDYCYYGEFKPADDTTVASGWCSTP